MLKYLIDYSNKVFAVKYSPTSRELILGGTSKGVEIHLIYLMEKYFKSKVIETKRFNSRIRIIGEIEIKDFMESLNLINSSNGITVTETRTFGRILR